MDPIPKDVLDHYLEGRESERLLAGVGELEFLRTMAILERVLPAAPSTALDVGGGAGVYALPLASRGYEVHLVDPVELHVEQARAAAVKAGVRLGSASLGDARRLGSGDSCADAVLLLGPLYHLIRREDRVLALREAHRVLRSGGVLVAAGISRFASLMSGVSEGIFADPVFRGIVEEDLASGQHRNRGNPLYFTTAFFHRPEELAAEVREAGFAEVEIAGVEGPIWGSARFDEAWRDPAQREALLRFLAVIEREPSVVAASAHVLAVARRG